MEIFEPTYLNEIGGRSNNEDSIYPSKGQADTNDRLFVVCDGVGGSEKGEVASSLICSFMPRYFSFAEHNVSSKVFLEDGLKYVEFHMIDHIKSRPETRGMASTLTLLHLSETNEALVGWVGDSRIYHIRDGHIKLKSKDHSEVQGLIDMGEITEEEALTHPRRNVITRAVNGEKPARIDQSIIKDIRENDYFLLCTDGILETLREEEFSTLFTRDRRVEDIRDSIFFKAKGNTKDNFSMYLIKVDDLNNGKKNSNPALISLKKLFENLVTKRQPRKDRSLND